MTEKQALVLLICFILIWGGFGLDLIIWKIKRSKSMQNRNYRECAIEHLKQGNLCKGYIDYILDEMEKLEKIEQIVKRELSPLSLDEMSNAEIQIREIFEQE